MMLLSGPMTYRHVVGTDNVGRSGLIMSSSDNQLVRATLMGVTPHEMNKYFRCSGFDESHIDDTN